MKVGIITINDYSNYGNRFQNYAAQEVLKKINVEPTTIANVTMVNKTNSSYEQSKIKRIIRFIRKNDINILKRRLYLKANKKLIQKSKLEKENNFRKFTNEYINETNYTISKEKIPSSLANSFDYFIVGSDQVWNPSFKRFSEVDFITFAPKEKRIAYSPSFGVSKIPKEHEVNYKEWINEMRCLSVREDAGAELIKNLTGRDAIVLVDPTMMLDKEDWFVVSKEAAYKPKTRYLCTYFLGETYDAHKKDIMEVAKQNKLKLVNLGSVYDLKRYSIDPGEFLDYIASSEIFMTDSFHGAIFSIIFNKPFVVFDRLENLPSMNSRIDTLLSKFNFEDRKWESIKNTKNYYDVDFSHTGPILEYERSKAYEYLKTSLNVKDAN